MADLATESQVVDALGRSLTTDEEFRLGWLLSRASAVVRSYAGQEFSPATASEVLRVRDGRVTLTHEPVQSITSVTWTAEDGTAGAATSYTFDGIRTVTLDGAAHIIGTAETAAGQGTVHVTYDHGHDSVPADVLGIVVDAVIRQLLAPGGGVAGLRYLAVGGVVETYSDQYTSGQVFLTGDDKAVLDRYRRRVRTARVGG